MRSNWIRILCMTTCFLVLFGSTTSSAQSYEILSINPLQSSQSKPYKYISPNVTPTQKNNVSTMLSQAGISDLFDTNNNPLLPQSEGDYQWHTFYGSNLPDEGYGVASDVSGGVFIVGMSFYTWNGPDGQEPLNSHSGEGDLTILKLDKSGSYKWHTFFGSDSYDDAVDIVIGDSGAVYIVGSSGGSWNGPDGQAPLHSFSGVADITVLKLDDSGAYQWHTFYGSNMGESSTGITLDSIDDVYINSYGNTTWNGPDGQEPLHSYNSGNEISILKLNSNGVYQWHTFYGSASNEFSRRIIIDSNVDVYILCRSGATWNGPNDQAPLHAFTGSGDLTVLKLNASGTYQWHTFYGSNLSDDGISIALDGIGYVYIVGSSSATWNGPEGQAPLHSFSGVADITVLKLDDSGAYQWHTFYGSNETDYGRDIISDYASGLFIGSYSKSTWNGPDGQEPLHPYSGLADFTVLKLDNDGIYQWHTFYGSNYDDIGMNITLSSTGGIYLIGWSADAWEGPSGEAPLHTYSGDYDFCILMLQGNYLPPIADFIASPTEGIAPLDVVFTNLSSGDYSTSIWDFGDGITSTLTSPTHTYYIADTFTVKLSVTGPGGFDEEVKTGYITVTQDIFRIYLPSIVR